MSGKQVNSTFSFSLGTDIRSIPWRSVGSRDFAYGREGSKKVCGGDKLGKKIGVWSADQGMQPATISYSSSGTSTSYNYLATTSFGPHVELRQTLPSVVSPLFHPSLPYHAVLAVAVVPCQLFIPSETKYMVYLEHLKMVDVQYEEAINHATH
jgi:hypothetical protein